MYVPLVPVIAELELQICNSFLKVLMTFLLESLALPLPHTLIHLKMDCTVTWTNTLLRAAINTFCQKLQAVPDGSSITICIKQRAFYDCQSDTALSLLKMKGAVSKVHRDTHCTTGLHVTSISNHLLIANSESVLCDLMHNLRSTYIFKKTPQNTRNMF